MNGPTGVLIIVENLPVPLDRRVWQEACALRDAGYEVTVICPQMRGYVAPHEVLEDIHIFRHPIAGEAAGVWGFVKEYTSALWGEWRASRRASKAGRRWRVIHLCNPPDILFLVALPWKLFRGTRVIFDIHDLWPEMFVQKFGRTGCQRLLYAMVRFAEWLTLKLADVVIATNESVKTAAMRRGRKNPNDVFVVRTSPKAIDVRAVPDPSLKKGRTFLAGYIGVMGTGDNVSCLLRSAHHLVHVAGRRDVQFLVMGTGVEFDNLVALRDELGLTEFVDLPGRVSDEFLATALASIDVGVSCDSINDYNHHCTMNKVLEYLAFGKAQVMFDLREGRVSAGDAALYVTPDTPESLSEGIARLLDDAELRGQLGRAGSTRLHSELSWETSTRHLLAAYARALA